MAVITINGHIGSGGPEIGALVARSLGADYVDRLVLAVVAKQLGATVAALADKELRAHRLSDRVVRFFQTLLERSAVAGAISEPFATPGIEALVARDYDELEKEPLTTAQQVEDARFIEATREAIEDLAKADRVIIMGRASNFILRDFPGALHVGLIASDEHRLKTIMRRERLGPEAARLLIEENERARVAFFQRYFKTSPHNPALFNLVINLDGKTIDIRQAADIIVTAALATMGKDAWEAKVPAVQEVA